MEQELEIKKMSIKDKQGNDINNLTLKTRVVKATGEVLQGLKVGNHIIVEKIFAEGYKNDRGIYSFYSCKAKYKGVEVSFLLNEKEHESYKEAGGIGDKVKISLESYEYTYKNEKKTANKLVFQTV